MPRFEDSLAYAAFTLLALGVALGAGGAWQAEILLHTAIARQLYLLGAAAGVAAAIAMVALVGIAEIRGWRAAHPARPRLARAGGRPRALASGCVA
ncbi:MAG TPA: hypothetical protein VGM87_10075 [Roseomonas sp.]|jgi:hypothetical protein